MLAHLLTPPPPPPPTCLSSRSLLTYAIAFLQVFENQPAGTVVGKISFTDEDKSQSHTLLLVDSDNSQFALSGKNLIKTKSTDYETKKAHKVKIRVTDNGTPALFVSHPLDALSLIDIIA